MPVLYLDEYRKSLEGKTVFIACREGIVRNFFKHIISDIKFLYRQKVHTFFFHNISNRFANQKIFRELESRLFNTQIVRVPSDMAFYPFVLNYPKPANKILFIERSHLLGPKRQPVNTLTTQKAREHLEDYRDIISNENLKENIVCICNKIENKAIERVHIIPAGKQCIKNELFSLEGSGTLIANNFNESFEPVSTENDIRIISSILKRYRSQGYLKPRDKAYVLSNKNSFYAAKIDDIIVGCAEKIFIDKKTVELGSLAVSVRFRKQQVGHFIIQAFEEEMFRQGMDTIISLTRNPLLQNIFLSLGYVAESPERYKHRQELSPDSLMFINSVATASSRCSSKRFPVA
ncbi:N-acetylglutamate synthase [Candidatus Magnetomorum sp. HK-1]|nr:N-acetylglutamate synthase [Candidatus Magnetomorum sp. HK-1]